MKFMMAIHYLIILTEDESLIDRFLDHCSKKVYAEQKNEVKVTDVKQWIESTVLGHYQTYIQKLCTHLDFFTLIKKSTECQFKTIADLIVAGFKALNLVNFIL